MEKVLTLNGVDYLVVSEITHNNNKYIYAINSGEKNDVVLLKETNEEGKTFVESVTDENEFNEIISIITKD